jgi:MFS family permease
MSDATHQNASHDAPTAELMRRLSDQMGTLVRQEIELAKTEVSEKGKRAGIGAGMFGGAGVAGLYMVGTLLATIIAALSLAMDTWVAALIVTVVLGAVAAILALQGKSKVQEATPPAPERTIASVKRDADTIKASAKAGRSN